MTTDLPDKHFIRVSARGVVVRDGQALLIAFEDAGGFHYNIPGGGIERGETARETTRRELREEAGATVIVGRLLLTYEYEPGHHAHAYGPGHALGLVFACDLEPGSEPGMPETPDGDQVGVHWVPLDDLSGVPLIPNIGAQIVATLRTPHAPTLHLEHLT